MIDYDKIIRIAERIEAALGIDAGKAEEIDKRTEKEKKESEVPAPCLEAEEEDEKDEQPKLEVKEEKEKENPKVVNLKKILAMIKSVKDSSLPEDKKKEFLAKIRAVAKLK